MLRLICDFWSQEDGQNLMEYSLFLCFFALACVAFLGIFHPYVASIWQASNTSIQQASSVVSGS